MDDDEIKDQLKSQLETVYGRIHGAQAITRTPRYMTHRVEQTVTLIVLALSSLGVAIPGITEAIAGEETDLYQPLERLGHLDPTFQTAVVALYALFAMFWVIVFVTKTRERGPLLVQYCKEMARVETALEKLLSDLTDPRGPVNDLQLRAMEISTRYHESDAVPWRVGPPGWELVAAARFEECWEKHRAKWRKSINVVQSAPQPGVASPPAVAVPTPAPGPGAPTTPSPTR